MADRGQAEASSPWTPDLLPEAALDGGMLLGGPDTLPCFFKTTFDDNFSPATTSRIQARLTKHPLMFLDTYAVIAIVLFGLFNFWPRAEGKASSHKPPSQDKKKQGRKATKGADQTWCTLHTLFTFCSLRCYLCGQASEVGHPTPAKVDKAKQSTGSETLLGTEEEGKNGYDFQVLSAIPGAWPITELKSTNDKTEEDDKQDVSAGYEEQVIVWDDLPSMPGQWPLPYTALPTHQEMRFAQTTSVLSTEQATPVHKIIPPAAETFDSRTALTLKEIASPADAEKITLPKYMSFRPRSKFMAKWAEFGGTEAPRPTQEVTQTHIRNVAAAKFRETKAARPTQEVAQTHIRNVAAAKFRETKAARPTQEVTQAHVRDVAAAKSRETEASRPTREVTQAHVRDVAAAEFRETEASRPTQEVIQAHIRDVAAAESSVGKRNAAVAAQRQFDTSKWRRHLKEQRRSAILSKERDAAREAERAAREAEKAAREAEKAAREAERRACEVERTAREAERRACEVERTAREAERRAREVERTAREAEGAAREAEGAAREAESAAREEVERAAREAERVARMAKVEEGPKIVQTTDSEIVNAAQPEPVNGPEPGNVNESAPRLNSVAQSFARPAATAGPSTANEDGDSGDLGSDIGSLDEDDIATMNAFVNAWAAESPQQDLDMYEGEPTPFNRDDTGDVIMT
jgi:hypothetical protein